TVAESGVDVTNFSTSGVGTALVRTNVGTGIGRTAPADAEVTVNTGEESGVRPGAFGSSNGAGVVPDDVSVTLSPNFRFQINAGSPLPPGGSTPTGDRLQVVTPAAATVFSDTAGPPNVSITSSISGNPTQPVTFENVELLLVTPGNGVVNLQGDNNNTVTQDDSFVVLGQDVDSTLSGAHTFGDNDFSLLL